MTIKYKFNKSSEARDCVVESVELVEIQEEKRMWKSYSFPGKVYDPYSAFLLEKNKDVEIEKEKITYSLKFTSQKELKDYINAIQKPIEFIAYSDIDQVLMKEWIGDWEEKHFVYDNEIEPDFTVEKSYKNTCWTFRYKNQVEYNSTIDGVISTKTGSPKLNSNWTFKIN
jgi:hypothetical protein